MATSAHVLKPLKPQTLPRRFLILSVQPVVTREGAGVPLFAHRLRVWALRSLYRSGENCWDIKDAHGVDTESLLTQLDKWTRRGHAAWLFGLNLAYQFQVSGLALASLTQALTVHGYNLGDKVTTISCSIKGKELHCVDTGNYWWSKASYIYGLCKQADTSRPCDTDGDSTALDRARRQCEAVSEFVMRLVTFCCQQAGSSWGHTLAGIAWGSWRHGLCSCEVQCHGNKEATELERESYLGGRIECRYIGTVNGYVNELDYNSLYAHCMDAPMPVALRSYAGGCLPSELYREIKAGSLVVARVKVNSRLHDYPYSIYPGKGAPPDCPSALPSYMRTACNPIRIWGRGKFTTTLATPELMRALESDELMSVDRVAWYEPGLPFKTFTAHWYQKRLDYRTKGRALEESLAKRMLTVLPGKFGQKSHEWINVSGMKAALPFGHWYKWDQEAKQHMMYRSLAGAVQVYVPTGEWKHSFPALSSHVTSAARCLVDSTIEIAGPYDVYYYDTDCLHVSNTGLKRLEEAGLIDGTALGKLKRKSISAGAGYRNCREIRFGGSDNYNGADRASSPNGDASSSGDVATSPVYHLLQSGPDAWRSVVAAQYARRNRYAGRVGTDGWVRPLQLPEQIINAPQGELFDDNERGQEAQRVVYGAGRRRASRPNTNRRRMPNQDRP